MSWGELPEDAAKAAARAEVLFDELAAMQLDLLSWIDRRGERHALEEELRACCETVGAAIIMERMEAADDGAPDVSDRVRAGADEPPTAPPAKTTRPPRPSRFQTVVIPRNDEPPQREEGADDAPQCAARGGASEPLKVDDGTLQALQERLRSGGLGGPEITTGDAALEDAVDAYEAYARTLEILGTTPPDGGETDPEYELRRLEKAVPLELTNWVKLSRRHNHGFTSWVTARGRALQRNPATPEYLHKRIENLMRALVRHSGDTQPGNVHGLALAHEPRTGSWLGDARRAEARVRRNAPVAAPDGVARCDKRATDLLRRLCDASGAGDVGAVEALATEALEAGVSPNDRRLARALEPHRDRLGDAFDAVPRVTDDASTTAEPRDSGLTMAQVIDDAETEFADKLTFSLNSASDGRKSVFGRPEQCAAALRFLATTYWDAKSGTAPCPDFDYALRNCASGWQYLGNHSEGTMKKYEGDYRATWNGRRYWLPDHIGRGTSKSPHDTIRVGFTWLDDEQRVLIGYIGQHQRTDTT